MACATPSAWRTGWGRFESELKGSDRHDQIERNEEEFATSEILAAAAHDMRQPLHGLNLLLSALAARAEDAETAALVKGVQVSADGVSGVIEALLAISAMRAGGAANAEGFAIDELLGHCCDQFARQAETKDLELRVVFCAHRVQSDRLLLQRMLDVLIAGAIRHSERGRVLIGCRRAGGTLRIGILDQGPGLDGALLAHFSGAGELDEEKAKWRGHALGLSIAHELCAAAGHDMSVISEPDRGTAVWLSIPLEDAAAQAQSQAAANPEAATEGEALIMLVEDEPEVFLATSLLLTDWGYSVAGGATAEAAIKDCEANGAGRRPDLLLSDFRLADSKTAMDVIQALNDHYGSEIPAIIVSGDPSAAQDVTVGGRKFEILQKPIRAARLRTLIRLALESGS